MKSKTGIKSYKSDKEKEIDHKIIELFNNCPIPEEQLMENLGLFFNAKNFSRIIFMHHIYSKIKNIHGVVMDFGTRWGHNLALFSVFRGMYEPFNRHRKLIGFDTFSHKRSVMCRSFLFDVKQKYAPFTPAKLNFIKFALKRLF